jgi:prolipoprotein diacylglyceryltransferase
VAARGTDRRRSPAAARARLTRAGNGGALFGGVLLPLSLLLLRRPQREGVYVGLVAIAYAVPRFFLDTLRREVDNPRYLALTPAQWCCIATVIAGTILLARRSEAPPEPYLRFG